MASMREFAEQAGLTPRRLQDIEAGTGEPPTIVEIAGLARALNMPAWRLIQLAEEGDDLEEAGSG